MKLLDDMLNVVWYQAQLRRMARGLVPLPGLGRLFALVTGFFLSYAANPFAFLFRAKPGRIRKDSGPLPHAI